MNLNFRLILGSKSPRRQELLRDMGFAFKSVSIDCDESYPSSMPHDQVAVFLAKKKSNAYQGDLPEDTLLITADTVVGVGNSLLGKPEDENDAQKMLQSISGKKHFVTTGVCLKSKTNISFFDETTEVYFKKLSTDEITYYINNYKPFDKAGAYGIQEWIGMVGIEKITGSYFNVVGLPTQKLYTALQNFPA